MEEIYERSNAFACGAHGKIQCLCKDLTKYGKECKLKCEEKTEVKLTTANGKCPWSLGATKTDESGGLGEAWA